MLFTTNELCKKFNVSKSKLTKVISSRNINGFWIGRTKKFDENEIELNLRDYNEKINPFCFDYNSRKVKIIEFYIKHGSIRKVTTILGIGRQSVTRTINEYLSTGCIEVDSKLKNLKNNC